jgi:hypothetical protein
MINGYELLCTRLCYSVANFEAGLQTFNSILTVKDYGKVRNPCP